MQLRPISLLFQSISICTPQMVPYDDGACFVGGCRPTVCIEIIDIRILFFHSWLISMHASVVFTHRVGLYILCVLSNIFVIVAMV